MKKCANRIGYRKTVLSLLLVAVMLFGMCPQIAFAATDVTLTFKSGATQDGEGRYLLYFEGLGDTADKYWNNNTVYIDGKEVSGDGVHYLHLGSDFALLLYYNAIEENVTAASGFSGVHTLQIKSGTSLANGEYTVSNDVWLKLNGYEVAQLTPVELTYTGSAVQDWGTRFAFTFSGFADTADKYWNGNTVYIDGKAVSGEGVHYLPDSGDNINLYLYYAAITANAATADALGAHTLEIPAGTLLGSYVINKCLKFQIDGEAITQIADADVTVTLSNDDSRNKSGNCTAGFYFYVSPADSLASDVTNWSVRYAMTTGGIYVNDTLIPGARLIKLLSNLYYVAFDGCGITFAANDVVKIAGTVTSDGYTVEYTEQAFQYDGNGAWDIYTAPVGNKFALDESDPGGWQGGDLNRYLIWLSDDISNSKTELGTVRLLVDGEMKNVETALIDGRYLLILNAACGITAMGEHSVQITAGQSLGEYTVLNDITVYTHADGSVNTTAPVYVTLGLSEGGWQGDPNNRYLAWLSDDISGDKPTISSITAEVNGESKAVTVALIDGKYALVLDSSCGISELNENYLQITAGQYFGSYIVLSDLTIYTHEDGSVDAKEPTIDVPADRYVTLIAKDENGEIVMNRAVAWNADSIALTEQELKDSVADGQVLLGYVYADALYASLANINTEELTELEITLNALDFAVHSELRHGSNLADSGLRFVAGLGDPSYSKVLLIADSEDKLNVENADYKIGDGISADFKQITAMDGAVCYSLALTNIPAADYNKTYYAAGAILVAYADGSESYVYTDAVASTVNEAAKNSAIASDSKTSYVDGVIHLDAKANLIGSYSYTAEVSNNANGDYVITYTGAQKVEALTIVNQRFTAADGATFGDGVITIPVSLFANAMLQEELAGTNNKLQIGAYRGPAIGLHTYTDSDGVVTDYSVTRTHDEVYADLEDFFAAGFNIWMAEEWIYGASSFGDNDALSALDLAAEYCINHGLTGEDIQVLITDSLLNGLLEGYTMPENAGSTVAEYAAIIAERFDVLKNYNPKVNGIEVGTEYNCFAGYILRDEPYYDHLDYYNGWFSFLGADSDQSISVIANSASTGGQVSGTVNALGMLADGYTLYFSMLSKGTAKKYIVSGSTSEDPCTTEEFTAYLRKFVDGINSTVWNYSNMMLTTDSYGLNTDVSSKFGSTAVTSTEMMNEYWQETLALVASLVEEKNPNATFATVLRSFGMTRLYLMAKASTWYNSVSWTEFQKFDAAWGQQAMDLQAYTSLAHGYTYLSYFTYWETQNQSYKGETFTDACVMWDDNMNPVKQNMYYWVKNTNAEIRAMENLIGSFSYSGTAAVASGSSYYCGTDGLWSADQLAGNTAIASVTATADTTVGHYTKDGGNFSEMFILVNMSHPEDGSSDTVTVTFDSGYTSAIVYINGEATLYQLSGGVCTVTIPSGEGVVVLPVA